MKQDSQPGLSTDPNVNLDIKAMDNLRQDMIDLSLAELPKTTKDPLLASRELLSSKQYQEGLKSTFQIGQTNRVQKVPMNLFTMENCDILNVGNPQYVSVYAKEIFDHLLTVEVRIIEIFEIILLRKNFMLNMATSTCHRLMSMIK